MGLAPQLITNSLYNKAVEQLKTLSKDNRQAIRLRAIVSAKELGVNLVAKVFAVTSNTIRSWVKNFEQEGISGLEYKKGRGRKSNLSKVHYDAIYQWTQEDCNITINHLVIKLRNVFGIQTSKSAIHRALHALNMSYITPRPVHYKQDKNGHAEFKKKPTEHN